ncbi:fatty acid desaturase [Flagellatimonas centrodinii]|uniref:fatty acid desaturase n=1 Tax=Flagellatimonas centrodinii TaxID=2806210 RepID=UPI001FEE6642|nr:fatty acid desaturase [Flagellatimonas centrodinii]ULQ48019.1 fatty acid desaturase [Flagellatimonas centrodinii]
MRAIELDTVDREALRWVDGKKWFWMLSPAIPVIALASVLAAVMGAPGWVMWALPFFFYVIVPALDWRVGEDRVNAPESAVSDLDADRYYRHIVFAYIPTQYLITGVGAWFAVTGNLSGWDLLALVISTGVVNGVGINTAHELGHKTNTLERWLAKITLAPVAYGHFFIEHNKGHHKNVATPEDPASSRMGESFWAFLPRTVVGSLKSAWHIEAERLKRQNKAVLSLDNEVLQSWAMTVLLFGALTLWLGPWALVFLVAQAAFGFSLLEVVNYLEHYGLIRQKLPNGRYERCQPRHSWNSNHVVTNLLLYQLQRHSDHHANPTRRYQALRHFEDSPQLPSGYAAMILIAYFPPLWFKLMDPKVVAHHGGDLRKAHLHGPRRAALLQRWAHAAPAESVDTGVVEADAPAVTSVDAEQFQCPNCQYVYDPKVGCPHEGYPAGTAWSALPMSWQCPDCAVREKPDFRPVQA